MPTFTVVRDGTTIEDSVFDVDPVVETANPYGDYVVIKMDDRGGEKFENYGRGTRVEVTVDPDDATLTISSGETVTTDAGTTDEHTTVHNGGTYENAGTVTAGGGSVDAFVGYTVERRETEQSGADVLEVEAYRFDQFLRRNTVSNDQTGNLISEALADIIQTDTPVSYNAAKIDVGDDQELTRSYQGDPVENVLRDLAFKSQNEDFGVDGDLDAFFRPRETTHIDRGIDNTQWFNYDIPELGKEAINEVEVWFDDGDESVIVDDGTDKLDLQDSLDLPSPGTQRAELNRPLITDISDAEDIGRKYLTFRNATLSGTVTTYGLFDASPGDTIDITIDPRGIDAEFVIAATEYRWGRDETILTIVEKRGDVDDILTELNDAVQRVEMNGANRDAPKNRITTTNATAVVAAEFVADIENGGMTTAPADRFVNPGRRAVRDAWTGDAPPNIDTLAIGTDGAGLSRSNTALRNQTNSVSVTQSLPDATTVKFDASATDDGIAELGLLSADGTLISRATFDSTVDLQGTVEVTLSVANDDSVSRGVLTTEGQTAVRDVLADNGPTLPSDYGYGSDDSPVAESDTVLGDEVVSVSLTDILIQSANVQTEWESLVGDIADDVPLRIQNGTVETLQSSWIIEAENTSDDSGDHGTTNSNSNASGGSDQGFNSSDGSFMEWTFTNDYAIPLSELVIQTYSRSSGSSTPNQETYIDGNLVLPLSPFIGGGVLTWSEDPIDDNAIDGDVLEPGTHILRVENTNTTSDSYIVDLVGVKDDRFNYDYPGSPDGTYYNGPQNYPDLIERSFTTADTRRNVTEASFSLDANDVSNNFYVELANDGSTFTRIDNSETGSVTFDSPERGVDTNIGLGRYGSRTTATPQEGYLGQSITSWELTANPDAVVPDDIGVTNTRAVISPNTIVGETIREAGLKSGSTLLTRHLLAEFDVLADQRISSSETSLFTSDN